MLFRAFVYKLMCASLTSVTSFSLVTPATPAHVTQVVSLKGHTDVIMLACVPDCKGADNEHRLSNKTVSSVYSIWIIFQCL